MFDNKANWKIAHQGNHISVYKQKVYLTEGRHTYYDVVVHPGGAVMVAIDAQNRLSFITQPRPAVEQVIWEFPAGGLEPNEPPSETAKRELEEEVGVVAEQWFDLGKICTAPGFCNEILYLFAATGLTETATNFDEHENIETHWLTMAEADEKIATGEIFDAKTISLLYKLKNHPELGSLFR